MSHNRNSKSPLFRTFNKPHHTTPYTNKGQIYALTPPIIPFHITNVAKRNDAPSHKHTLFSYKHTCKINYFRIFVTHHQRKIHSYRTLSPYHISSHHFHSSPQFLLNIYVLVKCKTTSFTHYSSFIPAQHKPLK